MWPTITPTVRADRNLVAILRSLTAQAGTCRNNTGDAVAPGFQRWVEDAVTQLGTMFAPEDVERLVRTRAYWETIDMPASFAHVQKICHHEIDAVVRRLAQVTDQLEQTAAYWADEACHYVILDTNVYVEHETRFDETDWYVVVNHRTNLTLRLVVPQVVIDELDDLKRRRWHRDDSTKPWRIAQTLRAFEELFPYPRSVLPGCQHDGHGRVTIEALSDPLMHGRLDINDAEIIRRATDLKRLTGGEVTVVSNDTGMIVRAQQAGLLGVRVTPLQTGPPTS